MKIRFLYVLSWIAAGVVASAVPGTAAYGEDLKATLAGLLETHERVKAAEADLDATVERYEVAFGDYFPSLEVTADWGHETQHKSNAVNTHMVPREVDLELTQTLLDFGVKDSAFEAARLTVAQARAALRNTRQSLLLDGITAYLSVLSASRTQEFARKSEANIKRQTELEDARVQRGSGFSTDVLQAKTQLAGAQARRVRAEGALQRALTQYKALFDTVPADLSAMEYPEIPANAIPGSRETAVEIAWKENPQLRVASLRAEIAQANLDRTFADQYFPKFDLVGEVKHKYDVGGTAGVRREYVGKVELTYELNALLTSVNQVRASRKDHHAQELRYAESRDLIERQVGIAWQDFLTAQANAQFLNNQAVIAAEFLDLARKEREFGRRSLIDVLSGETALISAQSDATAAEASVLAASFRLLAAMGRLDLSVFE